MTMGCVGGIVCGCVWLEGRFAAQGNMQGSKAAKAFSRFFLIGAGSYLVYGWVLGMVALL